MVSVFIYCHRNRPQICPVMQHPLPFLIALLTLSLLSPQTNKAGNPGNHPLDDLERYIMNPSLIEEQQEPAHCVRAGI